MPSTSTLAGALAAIETRLAGSWTTTPITYPNTPPPDPWPPVRDSSNTLAPWVYAEIDCDNAEIRAFGTPQNQTIIDEGVIRLTVFVPKDEGRADARAYCVTLGEIFRQKQFYDSEAGVCVRSLTPRIDGGIAVSDDGNWFTMTVSIDFEFYHRA